MVRYHWLLLVLLLVLLLLPEAVACVPCHGLAGQDCSKQRLPAQESTWT